MSGRGKGGKGLGKGGAKRHRKVNELTQQCIYIIHIIPHPLQILFFTTRVVYKFLYMR